MTTMCDTDTAARLLDLLAEQRQALDEMRADLVRLGREIAALNTETKRGIGQVVSKLDRKP